MPRGRVHTPHIQTSPPLSTTFANSWGSEGRPSISNPSVPPSVPSQTPSIVQRTAVGSPASADVLAAANATIARSGSSRPWLHTKIIRSLTKRPPVVGGSPRALDADQQRTVLLWLGREDALTEHPAEGRRVLLGRRLVDQELGDVPDVERLELPPDHHRDLVAAQPPAVVPDDLAGRRLRAGSRGGQHIARVVHGHPHPLASVSLHRSGGASRPADLERRPRAAPRRHRSTAAHVSDVVGQE